MNVWEDIKVIDGRTKELREDFRQKLSDSEEILSIDEFVYQGGRLNEKLNSCLKEWKNFSRDRYVINALCQFFHYSCGEEERQKLFEELENKEELSEASEKILSELSDCLIRRIEELGDDAVRGALEQKYDREVIRKNLMDLQEDFFLEFLAPLCDMDFFSVVTFMWRAFKRDELSNYRTNEFLLNMAIEIHEEYEKDPTIEILYKLRDCYDFVSPAEEKETVPSQDGTRYIAEKSRFLTRNGKEPFRTEDYPEIPEILSWYKAAVKPSARDRTGAYQALFDETMRLYSDEIDDFLRVMMPEKKKRTKLQNRETFSVPVTVWYDNSKSTEPSLIRAGTRFFGKNCEYELTSCVELPHTEYVQVCVHAAPHPDNSKLPKRKVKAVPEDTVFTILEGGREKDHKPVIRNIRAVSINNIEPEKTANINPGTKMNSSLWTRPKWTVEDYKGKQKGTGFVVMEVMVGEQIPEDLCFAFEGFKFVPTEGTGKPWYSKKTVTVSLDTDLVIPERVKHDRQKKIYILDAVESITRMNPRPDVVIGVSNQKNRVTVPEEKFAGGKPGQKLVVKMGTDRIAEEAEDVSRIRAETPDLELFENYMYGQDDYDIVSGLDIVLTRKIGLDLRNLSSDWLTDSRIQGDKQWFAALSEYRQRSVILVLLFLQYIVKGQKLMKTDRERFVRNFRGFISTRMSDYRFDELYLGYPLDCLLLFLLSACEVEDMCDTLRMIYKENERVLRARGEC